MPKGYIVASVAVEDADAYGAYTARTPEVIARHGGRFIVRGGPVTPLEGEMGLKGRLVILEFPSVDAARNWYDSAEYQEIIPLRTAASQGALVLVEGFDGPTG